MQNKEKISADQKTIAKLIYNRISEELERRNIPFNTNKDSGRYFIIDNLLPDDVARQIYDALPGTTDDLFLRNSIREKKWIGINIDNYDPIVRETLFAFQEERIVRSIETITGLKHLSADPSLYASGLSLMTKDHFLNPHLDNSHNLTRDKYRVLNLLYYVTPDWGPEDGGALELWFNGLKHKPEIITPLFNRLVVMITDQRSLHSVQMIKAAKTRACISNYYFSPFPAGGKEYQHVTSFRGRPGEIWKDFILLLDAGVRNFIRRWYKKQHTRHVIADKSQKNSEN